MELLQDLSERRKSVVVRAEAVLHTAERRTERHGGDLSQDEQQRLDDLYANIDALDDRISELAENRERERQLEATRPAWASQVRANTRGGVSMHELRYGNWLGRKSEP